MSNFRRRLMMSVKKQNEYTELEYLESTGTQYIDTDFKPNNNTRIIVRAKMKTFATEFFFGTRTSVTIKTFTALFERQAVSNGAYGIDYSNAKNRLVSASSYDDDIHYFEIDKGKLFFDNVEYQAKSTVKFQCNYNLVLFGVNTSNTITKSVAYIYDCKIYDNDVLIRDMIPVLDKNGVACMYDKVNKKFYYNERNRRFLIWRKGELIC